MKTKRTMIDGVEVTGPYRRYWFPLGKATGYHDEYFLTQGDYTRQINRHYYGSGTGKRRHKHWWFAPMYGPSIAVKKFDEVLAAFKADAAARNGKRIEIVGAA